MSDKVLREHLRKVLTWGEAHVDWPGALKGLPKAERGEKPKGAPHSAWELLEHVRIAQWDILNFCRDPKHASPEWPSGYWPKTAAPPSDAAWEQTVEALQKDVEAMGELVMDTRNDLFAPIAHGTGQTILRQALLLADHNSYHLGQFVLLRRMLGDWPEK
jgi:DinB superfamily